MKTLLTLVATALILTGCGANAETKTTSDTNTLPANHPQVAGAENPAPAADEGATGNQTLTGKIAETMSGGGYTYMRITSDSGDTWAAVPKADVKVGDEVTITVQMTMNNFESTALNRKFDSLAFATMGAEPASPHGGAMGGMGMGMGAGHGTQTEVDVDNISVEKAEGANAKTVAELWAERTTLKDSKVVVRGKVVKFLPSIMGRNWVHLRDGSGTAEKADNDITVTTDATVNVGDVVVATGVVRIDKDLGAGYSYPVILEEGTFTN